MKDLTNEWEKYWKDRVNSNGSYYGKEGSNAERAIDLLEIKKNDKVLDIGCGVGAHLSDIKNKVGAECYGIDISPIAVKLSKDKRIKLKVADMEKTTYPDNFFTKVFSLGVYEHTPNSLSVFKELNRVLKKGGIAYITVPNKYSFYHITKNIRVWLGTWDLGYEKSFSKPEIKQLLNRTGFRLKKYWVERHTQRANIFNVMDNALNKINKTHFGFFIHFSFEKTRNAK
jgi:ubiquinone/menaquinone biosynthesis C-methylase UbiE